MIARFLSKVNYIRYKYISFFDNHLFIGNKGRYNIHCIIEKSKDGFLDIGDNCTISVNDCIRVREGSFLKIGNHVFLNNNVIITCRKSIKIGDDTIIGPNVCIFDHDHNYKSSNRKKEFVTGTIEIGKNVWIGAGAILLKNISIEDNAVIAAGAIVSKDVKANTIYYSQDKQRKINNEK